MENTYKKIYISGIGGIGVSAIAKLYLKLGAQVLGSDIAPSEITKDLEKRGVKIFYSQTAENIPADLNILIYSPAVPENNPERHRARELGIEQRSYPQVLGDLSWQYHTIAISGTNGKSTTTAMIGSIMTDAKKDPLVIVGSKTKKFDANFRFGQGGDFVVEACEYRGHMLNIHPSAIILTNIEKDHLDYFTNIEHILETFQNYCNKLTHSDDVIVYNRDDYFTSQIVLPKCHRISYSLNSSADYVAKNIKVIDHYQEFSVYHDEKCLGIFQITMPGVFNVYNALSAIAFCHYSQIPVEIIKKSLKTFTGLWRRFEIIENRSIVVVSDYAHHPTAVHNTIRAAKDFYPGQRIIAVFQPHQHNRTIKLFDDFVKSFNDADVIVLPEIFDVVGREKEQDQMISSQDLVNEIKKNWPDKLIYYTGNLDETVKKVNSLIRAKDVVLLMGAGDINKINKQIKYEA